MRRRCLLAVSAALLAAPHVARSQATRTLRFIARGDPGAMDATADPRAPVADAALLFGDTLYGVDSRLEPQPQLCAGHDASDDCRVWRFRLRSGLRFHDGTPVLARDAVASLQRWMARDRMGGAIRERLDTLEALDDLTFRFRLRRPFGPMLYALGKTDPPLAVIIPERLARTDPAMPISEPIGCGPMRVRMAESNPGTRLVFERFADYAVREEAGDWLAGGKRLLFERIEWTWPDDAVQAAGALQTGDADWWVAPAAEQVPILKRNRNLLVDIADPLGRVGVVRLQRALPPFDDVRVRRAVLLALGQDACMAALTGGDDGLWRPMTNIFTPGTPAAAQADITGAPPLPAMADLDAARRMVSEGGAAGLFAALQPDDDAPAARAQATSVVPRLQRIGLAAELRMAAAPWHAMATSFDGASAATPTHPALDDAGEGKVADARTAWFEAVSPQESAAAVAAVNRAAVADAVFVPTGMFMRYHAWRTSLSGMTKAPLPVFWGVQKT